MTTTSRYLPVTNEERSRVSSLVEQHYFLVQRFMRLYGLADHPEAASEAHIALWRAACAFVGRKISGDFHGYAVVSVRNALMSLFAAEGRHRISSLDHLIEERDDNPLRAEIEANLLGVEEPGFDQTQISEVVCTFLAQLSPRERDLIRIRLTLAEREDYTLADVAQMYAKIHSEQQMSADAIRKALQRLRQRFECFREEMNQADEDL